MQKNQSKFLFLEGKVHTVYLCQYGKKSWDEFSKQHQFNPKGQLNQLLARLSKYAETGELQTPRQLNREGDGFFAIKSNAGLRCYFWFEQSDMVISHFYYKKSDTLPQSEKERMKRNRKSYGDS